MTSRRRKKKITKMKKNRPHRSKRNSVRKTTANSSSVNPAKSQNESENPDVESDEAPSTGWTPRGSEDIFADHPELAPDDEGEELTPKYKRKQERKDKEFEDQNPPAKKRKKRSPLFNFLGGVLGGIIIVGGITAGGYALIQYESNSQQEDAKKEQEAQQQPTQAEQCYTISADLPVATGNPTWDEALRLSLSKMDDKEKSAFNDSIFKTGDPSKANPYWKDSLKKAKDEKDLAVEPHIQIGADTQFVSAEEDKTTYSEGVMQLQEGMPAGVYRMQYQVSEDASDTHDIVLIVSGDADKSTLVFPAENDDNESAVAVNTIQPICGGTN